MILRIVFYLLLIFLLTQCFSITRVRNVTYYHNTNALEQNKLRLDGYFYKKTGNIYLDEQGEEYGELDENGSLDVNYSPMILYQDGTVFYSNFMSESLKEIGKNLRNSTFRGYSPGASGAYRIDGDTIKIQTLYNVAYGTFFISSVNDVMEFRGLILNDSTFVIKEVITPKSRGFPMFFFKTKRKEKKDVNIVYKFRKLNYLPSSNLSILKRNRRLNKQRTK